MSTALGLDGGRSEPPPPIPLHRRRLRLVPPPVSLTPLVGREAEAASVRALLTEEGARLVTLVGPGGIGKTRLALQVAAQCAAAFDGQIAWAPVATATTPEAAAAALAQAVGLAEAGATPTIEALKTALRDVRLLLVVDNFEQVLDAAPHLSDLLVACPELSLMVTSRALLRVTGERPVDIPPLATASDQTVAAAAPAVRLFAQNASGVNPAFALTPANAPAVAEICRRLDGLPLAIELAAARSRLFPPAVLLARLDRRLPQLTTGQRDAPARHRTMRDAIAWSYDLLSPKERAVFRCLSVFVGGCTLEAAETVCQESAGENDPSSDAVDAAIESLIAQSLLRIAPPLTDDGGPRLTMLETISEFAAEQLALANDPGPARRHAAYFLGLALRTEPTYWGDTPGYLRAGLESELGNLRAARGWAVDHGEADMALRLTAAMFDPHRITGDNAREQWVWTQRALAMPGLSPGAKAGSLAIPVWASQVRSSEYGALALGEEALALARQIGDAFGIANAAYALGAVKLHAGDIAGARELLSEALEGFRRLHASGRIGWTLCNLAYVDSHDAADEGGDPAALARSLARYEEALALFRAIGHPRGIARSLHGVAYLTFKLRDLPRALATTQEVLSLDWEQRWPMLFTYLEDIADIAGRTGQPEAAARLYGAADAQREQFGLPIDPPFLAEYERDVAIARGALGEAAFTAAWEVGRSLEPEQVVVEALAVTGSPASVPAAGSARPALSPREIEVLRLLATGLSDREIAEALFIGERTVNTHVARAFVKLGVHNRAAAVAAVIAAGFLDPLSPGTDPS